MVVSQHLSPVSIGPIYSWNAEDNDSLFVVVNEEVVSIGIFDEDVDEGVRRGTNEGGDIGWTSSSAAPPTNISYGDAKDQVHRVSLEIPSSYFSTDNEFKLTLKAHLNEVPKNDESVGYDNFKMTATFDCPGQNRPTPSPTGRPTPAPTSAQCSYWTQLGPTKSFDEENSLEGWTNGKRTCEGDFECFLGPYSKDDEAPYSTYAGIPTDASFIKLEFTVFGIDNVVADELYITIEDVKIDIGSMVYNTQAVETRGKVDDIIWRRRPASDDSNLGFGSENDAKHKMAFYIHPKYYTDGQIFVKTEATISFQEGAIGYDRFRFFKRSDCLRRRLTSQSFLRSSHKKGEIDMIMAEMDGDTLESIVLSDNNTDEDLMFMDIAV